MATIFLNKQKFTYTLQRQRRKTLQFKLCKANTIVIKAPIQLPLDYVIACLMRKANWIQQKNTLLSQKTIAPVPLKDGSLLPFMGKHYPLQISHSRNKPSITLIDDELRINLYLPSTSHWLLPLQKWYIQQALLVLTEKTNFWCQMIGTQVNHIAIKDQKTRWGSCSSLGNINYNWRIIMAPEATIDYLVIHEVSHRIYLNHSVDFWTLVQKYCPNYRGHKLWLKENGQSLFKIF